MREIAVAKFDQASVSGVLRLIRDAEGFTIREGLFYKPMGHKRVRVLTLFAGGSKRLTCKKEALKRFEREVSAMGASYV